MISQQRYRNVGFFVFVGLLALAAVALILPMWEAIAWGVALSILVWPLNAKFRKRMSDNFAAGLTTLLTLIFIITPLILVGLAVLGEAGQIRREMQAKEIETGKKVSFSSLIEDAQVALKPALESIGIQNFDLKQTVDDSLHNVMGNAPALAAKGIKGILVFIFALLLMFFILRDSHKLKKPALDLMPLKPEKSLEVLQGVYNTVHATFYGIVLVALLQGTILGVTFAIMGLPAPLLWGMACIVLCTIPFAGAPIIWVPTCLMLAAQGFYVKAIVLALIGAFVIGLVDNVFRPIIIGARVNLHPIAVFFSIFGGIVVLGPVGILVGPVLLSVSLGAVQVLREMTSDKIESNQTSITDATTSGL